MTPALNIFLTIYAMFSAITLAWLWLTDRRRFRSQRLLSLGLAGLWPLVVVALCARSLNKD